MRIVFCGNFQQASGSSQVVYNYFRAGASRGIEICISDLGPVEPIVANHIPVCHGTGNADALVIVLESSRFISEYDLAHIEETVPRDRRIVVDADGRFNNLIQLKNDSNHASSESAIEWRDHMLAMSDKIVQPRLSTNTSDRVGSFLYFGYEDSDISYDSSNWKFDVQYIGNNWYRWEDIVGILSAIDEIRHIVREVAIVGQGWDGTALFGRVEAGIADPELLQSLNVNVNPPVPFGQVVEAMSHSKFSPIFVRPILRHMNFATPRMFETLAANTYPLLPPYLSYTDSLYGVHIHDFIYHEGVAVKIIEILDNPSYYQELLRDIRHGLSSLHSYDSRLRELTQFAMS